MIEWNENTGVRGGTNGLYEGEIELKEVDPASFFPDPNAFRLEDCEYVHIVQRKPINFIKKHKIFGQAALNLDEDKNTSVERGEIYHRNFENGDDNNGLINFHQHFEKIPLEEGGFRYKVTYMAGSTIVHTVDDLQPRCYPFAILYDFPQRMDFWGKGTCEYILDNQRLLNKTESIIAMIGTLLQNPQKIVSKASGIDPAEVKKYGNAPGHTWVTNGDPHSSMVWQTPPQIPQALFNLQDVAKQNIREVTGLNNAYTGDNVGSLQTSQGVNALIDRATLRDRDQLYDVEVFIEDISRLILSYITTKYDTPRYLRIEGEQNQFDFAKFTGTDFCDLEYDFHIDVSSKAPVSRMREQNEAKELLNMQGQYQYQPAVITAQEYMEMSDFINKDKLIERMKTDEIGFEAQQLTNIAMQMYSGIASGTLAPEQISQFAMQMVQQMKKGDPLGSTSNSNGVQARQQGV
jgi:hypothetical protein